MSEPEVRKPSDLIDQTDVKAPWEINVMVDSEVDAMMITSSRVKCQTCVACDLGRRSFSGACVAVAQNPISGFTLSDSDWPTNGSI